MAHTQTLFYSTSNNRGECVNDGCSATESGAKYAVAPPPPTAGASEPRLRRNLLKMDDDECARGSAATSDATTTALVSALLPSAGDAVRGVPGDVSSLTDRSRVLRTPRAGVPLGVRTSDARRCLAVAGGRSSVPTVSTRLTTRQFSILMEFA